MFVMISLGMNPYINSQGFARTGMKTVVLGAVMNLVLHLRDCKVGAFHILYVFYQRTDSGGL